MQKGTKSRGAVQNTHTHTFSLPRSLCHPVSVLARALASTRAGRCSKTSSHFVPALLYPSGCAFKFPHLLLFTLSSSRAGTLPKIHTCTHTHTCIHARTQSRTHSQSFIFVLMTQFLESCEAHTRGVAGVFFFIYFILFFFFLSLPSFSFSTEQAKSRGSAGLWRAEAANFL